MGALDAIRNCYLGLGHVYRAQGKKDEAVATYQKAIDALESVRARVAGGEAAQLKFLHAEGKDDAYQSLVSLLMEQGKTADALRLLERARSKQLLDSLRLRSLTVRDANLHSLLTKTEDLEQTLAAQEQERVAELSKPAAQQDRTRVANLTQLVAQTRADLLKVANALRAANPDYERFITIKITDLRNVQARLPEDVVVVQYLPLETALTIFVVTRGKMQARSVAVSRKRMDELVATFHDDVRRVQESGGRRGQNWDWQSERAQRLRGALTALYGYLIGSVQADIAHARTVIVVPSGTLYYLPFQALARENADRSLTFLAEEKELTVLTSLDLWLQITNEDSAGDAPTPRVCALGNPDGTLPAAEQEVKRIGALFDRSLIYTGADVTRVRLESLPKDVTIAHFATHGQLSEQDINECNLVLANGDKLK
jgi:CHAT domain-containing protein